MSASTSRLYWVDHLRTFMILLVVNMHACVTYSHVGGWYYMVDPEPPMPVKLLFIFWQGHLQSFFMGLLFFLAGYFAERSLSRRGKKAFLAERWRRLGLPTLIFMLVIHPFVVLGLNPWKDSHPAFLTWYGEYLKTGRFIGATGPLWFAFALLIFCLGFAFLRSPQAKQPDTASRTSNLVFTLSLWPILGLGFALGIASFLVRLVQPIGTSILNFQLCFFVQYLVAFGLGIVVSQRTALQTIARSQIALRVGMAALFVGPMFLLAVLVLGGPIPEHGPNPFVGGWHGQALGLALWEQMTGVCLALGVMAWFIRYMDRDTPLLRWLSDRAFAVYVFHTPVLIALTMLYLPLHAGPIIMSAFLTVTGLFASFLLADLVHRVPGMRSIF